MLVDGKKIAADIAELVANTIKIESLNPKMVVVTCAPNFETRKYLELKQKKAEDLGVSLEVSELNSDAATADVIKKVKEAVAVANGVIVQLPLPSHIDTTAVLASVPSSHDVDAFSYDGSEDTVLPPVVGAIDEIINRHSLTLKDRSVVIFGDGRLVGAPAKIYAENKRARVTVLNITSSEEMVRQAAGEADVIILGVGKPNLLLPDMVKEGVVVFDAGASEDGGLLVGDASREVGEKASIFTPVPGGIGPITVSLLYRNLLELITRQ
jgi:methylenetetrahydrofolate dehydrogenase (NADP+)/methenyltetrahydrofolate cyclohydrolase